LKFSNNGDNKNEISHGRIFPSKRGASNNRGRGRGNIKIKEVVKIKNQAHAADYVK